ncbi:contractile injection system tape measure protein [Massilia sp. CFBP9012]|uniref:contractile injection system tape measure protein n=1 Tax=Massilia sp. CFBP9012 TaxID=3096531 RepID=UPI002A6A9DBE|nr:contractile injection system tape measure protein [Massilia sp. CFBP9012]MDY0973382.1 contractile injection system tape measure protein [Massilia sp. CFBP9012]
MSTPHLIDRFDVEIEFDPPDPGLQDEQGLLRLVREALLPVLDEVLDACDEPGTVLVLPSLALDLGTIERHALHEQAPARLRALLEDALAAARQQARLAAAGPGAESVGLAASALPSIRSAQDDALARLAAFLRSGRLGWDAPPRSRDLHVQLLDGLLASAPGALARMLADAIRQPGALRRLAAQFPPRQLEAVLETAAPGQARALLAWRAAFACGSGGTDAALAWSWVLGVALGATAPAAGLAAVAAAIGHPSGTLERVTLAPADGERLAAWWRRGERDAGAAAVLERLLAAGGGRGVRDGLARELGTALSAPDAARRLAGAMPLHLRERMLRFLMPSGAARLLLLMSEVERQLVSRVSDRGRGAEAHARCWLELLAAGLDGAHVVVRDDAVRTRLYAVLDAATQGTALPDQGVSRAADAMAPDELAQLAAFLERGRFDGALPLAGEQGEPHVRLLARLLERAGRSRAAREALLRMLVRVSANPAALRRLVEQFPQRQLAGLVDAAAPGRAAALLALLQELQDGARLDLPAIEDDARDAWRDLLLRALREGPPEAHAAAEDDAQLAGLEAWWRGGRYDPAGAARLGALLARVETEGVDAPLRMALARVLSAPDGALRLARALPERLRESLIRFALPGLAPRAIALMQRLRARHPQAPETCIDAWARLLTACLAPPVSAAAVQVLCERLDAELMPPPARDEAPAASQQRMPAALDELEAWWRGGQADAARAARMERMLARATAAGGDDDPGAGRSLAQALVAALARTVALPEGPRRLAAALPEQLGIALLWFAVPSLAPRLVALLQRLGRRLASRPDALRDCWAQVYALCLGPAPSSASVEALCLRLDAAAPPDAAPRQRGANVRGSRNKGALDGLEAWWRAGHADHGRAAQLERLLAVDAASSTDAAEAGALEGALAVALRRTLASPGGARRLVSAIPVHLRETLLARFAPAFASAAIVRLRALGRWLASTPGASGPAPGLHARSWAEVLEACLSPTVTAASVQALCARLDEVIARVARHGQEDTHDRMHHRMHERTQDGPAAWRGASALERLAAFLRKGRLLGAHAAAGAAGDGPAPLEETHVTLLDGLLASPSLQPLWRMLAAALARPAAARRMVEQFPERQLRDLLARAAPARAAALYALADELERAGVAAGIAPRRLRLLVWPALLGAAVRAAAGQAPLPPLKALRGAIIDRLAAPPDQAGAEQDGSAVVAEIAALAPGTPVRARLRELAGSGSVTALRALVRKTVQHDAADALLAIADGVELRARAHPGYPRVEAWADLLEAALGGPTSRHIAQLQGRYLGAAGDALRLRQAHAAAPASMPWQAAAPDGGAGRALRRLLSGAARVRAGGRHAFEDASGRAIPVPSDPAARRLLDACGVLETGLAAATAPPAALDAAHWLARISDHLAREDRIAPARRAVMLEAISEAARASGGEQACLRAVMDALERGAPLDLEAIVLQDGSQPEARHTASEPRSAVVAALLAADDDPPPPAWTALLERRGDDVLRSLRTAGRRRGWRAALREGLPQRMLADLVALSRPELGAAVRVIAERADVVAPVLGSGWQDALWRGAFDLAARPFRAATPDLAAACEQVLRAAAPGARERAALLEAWRAAPSPAAAVREAPKLPATANIADGPPGMPEGERIALANAGMVLMAPYLPRLFGMLGLVADGAFVDLDAAERAVHLLQFAASGAGSAPEYALPLNKLLCGLPLEAPVPAGISLTTVEQETIEGLLEAMIASWSALGRTSVEGLRQSFLMRDGELALGPQGWELSVVRGPFDMLMDRLPWSFSIVRFAWMPAPLHVTWN